MTLRVFKVLERKNWKSRNAEGRALRYKTPNARAGPANGRSLTLRVFKVLERKNWKRRNAEGRALRYKTPNARAGLCSSRQGG